jgi:hypothetical protein
MRRAAERRCWTRGAVCGSGIVEHDDRPGSRNENTSKRNGHDLCRREEVIWRCRNDCAVEPHDAIRVRLDFRPFRFVRLEVMCFEVTVYDGG